MMDIETISNIVWGAVVLIVGLGFGFTTYFSAVRRRSEPDPSTFWCPLWPGCDCPDGTMRHDCPGLEDLKKGRSECRCAAGCP